jgi:chromosomal replication initiation ATPase DnaA
MRSARLPAVKTLCDFDFTFQPSVTREQIESHTRSLIDRKENVLLLGPPGVGKTHLALILSSGCRGERPQRRLHDAGRPAALLEEAQAAGRLAHRFRSWASPA